MRKELINGLLIRRSEVRILPGAPINYNGLADLVYNFRSLGQRYGQHPSFGHQATRFYLSMALWKISPGSKWDLRRGYLNIFKPLMYKHLAKTLGVSFFIGTRTNNYTL